MTTQECPGCDKFDCKNPPCENPRCDGGCMGSCQCARCGDDFCTNCEIGGDGEDENDWVCDYCVNDIAEEREFYAKFKACDLGDDSSAKRKGVGRPRKEIKKIEGLVVCGCGSDVLRYGMKRHLTSMKHKSFIMRQEGTHPSHHIVPSEPGLVWDGTRLRKPGVCGTHDPIKKKEIIQERQNTKIVCECGAKVSRVNLPAHKRSRKHLQLLETGKWNREPQSLNGGRPLVYKTPEEKAESVKRNKEHANRIIDCECGHTYKHSSRAAHLLTQKHLGLPHGNTTHGNTKKRKKKKGFKIVVCE